ncbi:tumor necrosis factor receptor superfamily member wengen [Anabrus simplex]|uniref:tumor necrosis factor receptor superfamily member wengen n=1 Tax=Anabrus simplex TaxID=316456 RepID=UPI0035A2DA7E
MRTHGSVKVLPLAVLVVSLAVTTVVALCRTGRTGYQYWDEVRETCRNCSACTQPGHIVVRPCQVYQDTVCAPLHALNIDWSWLGRRPRNGSHHNHHKKHGHRSDQWSSTTFSNSSHVNHRYHKQWHRMNGNKSYHHHHHHHHYNQFHHHHHHKKIRPPESAAQLKTLDGDANAVLSTSGSPELHFVQGTPASLQQPPVFTTTEAIIWDWQAVVLALAVFACVLFFGVAAVYGVRQVRRDACRTADVEDLSAALSLMMPGVGGELTDSGSPVVDTCNTNQCLYMEKLLVCKQPDGRGNVYIDRDNTGSPRM